LLLHFKVSRAASRTARSAVNLRLRKAPARAHGEANHGGSSLQRQRHQWLGKL
jgi:hypothetical protein